MEIFFQQRRQSGLDKTYYQFTGIDGITFEDIEESGRESFLLNIQEELKNGTCCPVKNRRCEIPKDNGKVRILGIPTIKDRTVQGALKLMLEAIFEADFSPNNYGYRPNKSPHHALAQVRRSILRGMAGNSGKTTEMENPLYYSCRRKRH